MQYPSDHQICQSAGRPRVIRPSSGAGASDTFDPPSAVPPTASPAPVGYDRTHDIAVLALRNASGLPAGEVIVSLDADRVDSPTTMITLLWSTAQCHGAAGGRPANLTKSRTGM
ncbi:MAG: hypothetical protein DLM62_00960 [Pseudonocardiales bacterium]|nr:MAG: hypothetical protein DLM62_00960 [Pseudonocardiales bacterium]